MAEKVSIAGLDKADVLAVLYNAARPQGMGFLQYDPKPMTREEAESIIEDGHFNFDYLKGRVMKIDISGDEINPWSFDMDNGSGMVQKVIDELRKAGGTNTEVIQEVHRTSTLDAAKEVKANLHEESTFGVEGSVGVARIGLADMAPVLGPAVDKAVKGFESNG
jgi:hypothetical protein